MTATPVATATSRPLVATTRAELADVLAAHGVRRALVGLVPTMGALHDGHRELMRTTRRALAERADVSALVVSIFVNPLQFGPHEDLDRYPRTLEADLAACASEGVDVVFAPAVEDVYPVHPPQVTVDPGPLGEVLEGASRPGHFAGVLTVVAKLFGLVRPDLAVFGEKDYQQLVLIRRMVADLCQGVEVLAAPTVREPDGLALSSRNGYLSPDERASALTLSRALRAVVDAAPQGYDAALAAGGRVLSADPAVKLDYLALTAPDLGPAPASGEGRALVAARVGTTRLIDNVPLVLGRPAGDWS